MNQLEVVLASDHEFFYTDSDEVVPEGEPVGVDWTHIMQSIFIYFNIYHEFKYEEGEY